MSDVTGVAVDSRQDDRVARRIEQFKRKCGEHGEEALNFAYHAALPVALNPEFLHLLRINFFVDIERPLPYEVEFEFLLSSLCRQIDEGLYEVERGVRLVLLEGLAREFGRKRQEELSALLWQYEENHSFGTEQIGLQRAQKLTAYYFLDAQKTQQWLIAAMNEMNSMGPSEREWLVAMGSTLIQISNSPDISAQLLNNKGESFDFLLPELSLEINNSATQVDRENEELPEQKAGSRVTLGPQLIWTLDGNEQNFLLADNYCWMIGRNEEHDIVLRDRWISYDHAMINFVTQGNEDGEYYLIDLGSRNGTFINGRRVSIPAILRHSDLMMFGQTEVEFSNPKYSQEKRVAKSVQDHTATATLHMRRLVSILVISIRDFTALIQNVDEPSVSEFIGSWFRQMGEILRGYGNCFEQYLGSAVIIVWIHGYQNVEENEFIDILHAIQEVNLMTNELYSQFSFPSPLDLGIGLNTGFAMVGNLGSGDRPHYTPLGDTVNVAFSLESVTQLLQADIALGLETYRYFIKYFPEYAKKFEEKAVSFKGSGRKSLIYMSSLEAIRNFFQSQ